MVIENEINRGQHRRKLRIDQPKPEPKPTTLPPRPVVAEQPQVGIIRVLSNGSVLSRRDPGAANPSVAGYLPQEQIEEGSYFDEYGMVCRVRRSKRTDRLYAEKFMADSLKFEYTRGLIFKLKSRMTLEQAREWGSRFGRCCVCGHSLTANKSVDEGIGPVCITKI